MDHSRVQKAAVAAAAGCGAIALFQVALAAGAPLGHAAYGGGQAELTTVLRTASAAAVVVWSSAALIVLGRARLWHVARLEQVFRRGTWFFAGVLTVGALMNFASPSVWENVIMGPLALVLAILFVIVARKADDGVRMPSLTHAPA
jgi:hypothetical protein